MTTKEYLELVEEKLIDNNQNGLEVIQVWYCKTIQNHKGLFIIRNKRQIEPYFYECTYNGDKNELYIDCYTQISKDIYYLDKRI